MKKKLVIDFDTPIIKAAAVCQTNLEVVEKSTGKRLAMPSKKQFFLKYPQYKEREDDFLFETKANLLPDDGDFKIEYRAYKSVNDSYKRLADLPWADPVTIVVGGSDNFREKVAVTWPYKGNRLEKPLLTGKVKDYVKRKYSFQVESHDGVETDDVVSWYGWESYQEAKKKQDKKAAPTVIAHVDKDLNMIPGWHIGLDAGKPYWVSEEQGMKFFFWQLLCGDKAVDNIPGLNGLVEEIVEKFGVRRGKGIGKGSATKIIESCETALDAWKAVVFCYEAVHPVNWKVYMQEQADLLWMQRYPGSRFLVEEKLEVFK